MRKFYKSLAILVSILYIVVLASACNQIKEEDETIVIRGDRVDRLLSYQYVDSGFHFTADVFHDMAEVTYYARQFYQLMGQTDKILSLKAQTYNMHDKLPLEERIKAMDLQTLFFWTNCLAEDLKNDIELVEAVQANDNLQEVLRFESGNFSDFYNAVSICHCLNFDYDVEKLESAIMEKLASGQYDTLLSKYNDLNIIYQFNTDFGFSIDIASKVEEDFASYEVELEEGHEAETLLLSELYAYTSLGKGYNVAMTISDGELLEWLHMYLNRRGMYSQNMGQFNYDSSDPKAAVEACKLVRLCGSSVDTDDVETFFESCEKTNGWFTFFSAYEDSSPEDTYYAYESFYLMEENVGQSIDEYLDGLDGSDISIFSMILAASRGRNISAQDLIGQLESLTKGYSRQWNSVYYAKVMYQLDLGLELAQQQSISLPDELKDDILAMVKNGIDKDNKNISCRYLSNLLCFRLGDMTEDEAFDGLAKSLWKNIRGNKSWADMTDVMYIMRICQVSELAAQQIRDNYTAMKVLGEFLTECQNVFGLYGDFPNGRQEFCSIYAGLQVEKFLEE